MPSETEIQQAIAKVRRWVDVHVCGPEVVTLIAEHDRLKTALCNLLAVIHRDGGQHTAEHGLEKSLQDAHTRWGELQERADAHDRLKAELERLATLRHAMAGETK
jgi:hypothetical protein